MTGRLGRHNLRITLFFEVLTKWLAILICKETGITLIGSWAQVAVLTCSEIPLFLRHFKVFGSRITLFIIICTLQCFVGILLNHIVKHVYVSLERHICEGKHQDLLDRVNRTPKLVENVSSIYWSLIFVRFLRSKVQQAILLHNSIYLLWYLVG